MSLFVSVLLLLVLNTFGVHGESTSPLNISLTGAYYKSTNRLGWQVKRPDLVPDKELATYTQNSDLKAALCGVNVNAGEGCMTTHTHVFVSSVVLNGG